MCSTKRSWKLLTLSLLVASVLVTAPGGELLAQAGMDVAAARHEQRAAAEAKRARAEQRRRLAREQAHAQMPSTMYASTPDPALPPHPAHAPVPDSSARDAVARRVAKASAGQGHAMAFFPSAARWAQRGYQGFARIINRTGESGEVRIEAFDDAGVRHGPVTLAIDANRSVQLNSTDLESGNAGVGLSGGVGAGEGDWRLRLSSSLDLQVLSYVRTREGFLTSMHDLVSKTGADHRVVIFNPGRNRSLVSWLRVINPGEQSAQVRIEGIDATGESSEGAVTLSLAAGASRTLSAQRLESGEDEDLSGALGTGSGKWQLLVSADQPIEVMSMLSTRSGHLTNLSTAPEHSVEDGARVTHAMAFFPAAARWAQRGYQGFARIINRTGESGEVRIEAFDDAGVRHGPVTLAIDANRSVQFNSTDLESGNAGVGLSGGVGAGEGDWRLRLSSSLDLQVLSYIRTREGFLTSMHDLVSKTGADHRVVIFNPGRNRSLVSWLRVINPGEQSARVRIEGTDATGASSPGTVALSLAAGASRTLSAQQLESGEGLSGGLGTGTGKWQLRVSADQPIEVMSMLSTRSGHLTNLSTAPEHRVEEAASVFRRHISGPIVQSKCVACHVEGGVSGNTRLRFVRASDPEHEASNLRTFEDFLDAVDDAATLILNKIQGVAHGGGVQVAAGAPEFAHMERFLRLLGEEVSATSLTPQTLFDRVKMAPWRKTLRRAALIFAGRVPTEGEYAAVADGDTAALRATIRGLMSGPEFHEFLIRAANDRLLTNRSSADVISPYEFYVDYINETYRRRAAAHASGDVRDISGFERWRGMVNHGSRRAPLELIAHVVENDLPYTEILTADYIMANPMAAAAYGASTRFDDPEDPLEFKPSEIVSYYRQGDGYEEEYDEVVGRTRILDPGPLSTDYPHAGVLNTTAFLLRYPTTATNRNRARSRWTYYHFLGLDIEKSASRTTDPVALADTNNPTLHNPACTVCHRVLDPVAGTFQNYGDEGHYRDQWGGLDSLDDLYKNEAGAELPIRADSSSNRETLSWTLWLAAGVETLRVVFTNDYYDESTGADRNIHLDRLSVRDAGGRVLVRHELEHMTPPVASWGECGERRGDHLYLHSGTPGCALFVDVRIPADGVYDVEVVAWSNGRVVADGDDGFSRISVAANAYQLGDTWYRDMRSPGFGSEQAPNPDHSVRWLARKIVADDRFAEATVEFWWPAIMGREVAEPPEDEGDADFEGRLLAAAAQGAEVERLARGFRRGFAGRAPYNLKDLLAEIVLSKWFRADALESGNPVLHVTLGDAGARRLLTPEELSRKTAALTGVGWDRHPGFECWPECSRVGSAVADEYGLLYGGIDSDGITERARDLTSVMAGVAGRHAAEVACMAVMRELYLLPEADRRLFGGIDQYVTLPRGENAIRNKLVELHEKLLGVQVTPHSPDVEAAYQLFSDVVRNGPRSRDHWFATYGWFAWWECEWNLDRFFLEGILDEAVVLVEHDHGSWVWYGYEFDYDRVDPFLESVDWSDPHHAARAWVVVLTYLLMDYRYLYL